MFTDSVLPACPERTSCSRMMGGPGTPPASAGQMISSVLPAASLASTTPPSAGRTASAPNVKLPPTPPPALKLAVPEMKLTAGALPVAQPPSVFMVPAATSPTISIRSRSMRFCGTEASATATAPPRPASEAHGAAPGAGGGGAPPLPGPLANGLVVALPGPTSESVIPDRLQAPSEREARSPATTSAAWAVNRNFEDDTFMGMPPVRLGSHGTRSARGAARQGGG